MEVPTQVIGSEMCPFRLMIDPAPDQSLLIISPIFESKITLRSNSNKRRIRQLVLILSKLAVYSFVLLDKLAIKIPRKEAKMHFKHLSRSLAY